jgi:4-amino-4-deoxy-L-arabinose transferase-like glycosyltransferase
MVMLNFPTRNSLRVRLEGKSWGKALIWYVFLLLISLGLRIFLILIMNPGIENDSPSYLNLAHQIARLNLTGDTGFRTPIYPLFILLFNFNLDWIRLGQTVLGLILLTMLFWTAWHFTGNCVVSFLAGAFYGFNLAQIYFESKVLTETLTTFLVITCLVIFIRLPEIPRTKRMVYWVLGTGMVSALAALTRPLFLFLPPMLAVILFLKLGDRGLASRLRYAVLLFLPGFLLVGGWSIFNYFRLDYFGPSTFTGLGLADHSITFIQYAPDEYAVIRDIFMNLRQREGTHVVNIWEGLDQILKATGEAFPQLSKTLTQMSLYLIVRHPFLYLESVGVTWVRFWNEPGWWTWPAIRSETLQIGVAYAWRIEKYFLVFFQNLPFLILVAYSTIRWITNKFRTLVWGHFYLATMGTVILTASMIQALVERGDTTRYAIPVQPMIGFIVIVSLCQFLKQRKGHPIPELD